MKLRKERLILFIIIMVQIVGMFFLFEYKKDDISVDEAWSYGLANSYYEPYIYQEDDYNTKNEKNIGEWLPGKTLQQYLTVSQDQRFSYGSVFYNQACDTHPPFYYIILHTICSLFPGKFTLWFGFIINIITFIITEIYLFRLTKAVTKSSKAGLIACLFWGFTTNAVNNVLFIRMYSMLAMFAIMLAFYLEEWDRKDFENGRKYLWKMGLVTLLGALTQHIFLMYAFVFTVLFCLRLLVKKKIKKMFLFGSVMLFSVGISFAVFPATFHHVFGGIMKVGGKYPFPFQLKLCLSFVCRELFGISFPILSTIIPNILLVIFVYMSIVIVGIAIIFRKDAWFIKLKRNVIGFLKTVPGKIKHGVKNANIYIWMVLVTAFSIFVLTAKQMSVYHMGISVTRYLVIIGPLLGMCSVYFANYILGIILKKENRKTIVMAVIMVAFAVASNVIFPSHYLNQVQVEGKGINEIEKHNDIIVVGVNKRNWQLTSFSQRLYDAHQVFYVSRERCSDMLENINENKNKTKYLVVEYDLDKETKETANEYAKQIAQSQSNIKVTEIGREANSLGIYVIYRMDD